MAISRYLHIVQYIMGKDLKNSKAIIVSATNNYRKCLYFLSLLDCYSIMLVFLLKAHGNILWRIKLSVVTSHDCYIYGQNQKAIYHSAVGAGEDG